MEIEHGGPEVLANWLVANGYPQDDVPLALRHSRYWEENG
jgi:hypothetical protein